MMQTQRHAFPIHVRTGWIDFSPALHSYVTGRVTRTLSPFASRIASVAVRIGNQEPHDPATRLCAIDIQLKADGAISSVSSGRDVYDVVNNATDAILKKMRALREFESADALSRIA